MTQPAAQMKQNSALDHVTVQVARLPHAMDLPLPNYATLQSAGMDLCAAIDAPLTLQPGEHGMVPTGLSIALPAGFEAQVRPRSGLAAKNGVTVLNSPGTIDADYRGEIKAILINHSKTPFVIERGMRIAQMVVARHSTVDWAEVETLDETSRGTGGFGSTGTK
jgi:dUTP pyrophosphatase